MTSKRPLNAVRRAAAKSWELQNQIEATASNLRVVYSGSMAGATSASNMLALNASSGANLWRYPAGGSVIAGASIVGDTIHWGSGYSNLPLPGFVSNNKFYAFSVNGR
jgi:outer membrane protein assembly factor BamB